MRRACVVQVFLWWVVAAPRAGAVEPPPAASQAVAAQATAPPAPPAPAPQAPAPPAPQATTPPRLPPPRLPPPRWMPCCLAAPSLADIDALEQAGRRHKRLGAILMGTGGGIAAAGTALAIAGAWDDDDRCDWRHDGRHHHHGCGDSALSIAGATTALLGVGVIVPGIVWYISGGHAVDRARYLRRYYFGVMSLRPTVHPGGAALNLAISR